MDLLNQSYNNQKREKSKSTKIVITLLIVCIIMAVAIVILMVYIKATEPPVQVIQINGQQIEANQEFIISDSQGNDYVNLKELSEKLQYTYNNGEYQKYTEDKNKCYINDGNKVIGFTADSNEIYKTKLNSTTDYEYYTLKNKVLMYSDKLYVSVQDLQVALNVGYAHSNENNITVINTTEYTAETHAEKLKEAGYELTEIPQNIKVIAYGQLVVSKNDQWGVVNADHQEIIGGKYKSMLFDEYNMDYIVSNDKDQYGIIGIDGNVQIALRYDSLEIINYDPVLYSVSLNNKYGLITKDGTPLTNLEYDGIGFPAQPQNNIIYTLIIPALKGQTGNTIVVCKDRKYGLISMENGRTVIDCDELDAIYAVQAAGGIEYRVQIDRNTMLLEDYIAQRNAVSN